MEQNIFERLLEERVRLGLNKGEMATAGGVAKPTYLRYELGERAPDGLFFEQISKAGADVLYILTGTRTAPVESGLNKREAMLLENYRASTEAGKRHTEQSALLWAQQPEPKKGVK